MNLQEAPEVRSVASYKDSNDFDSYTDAKMARVNLGELEVGDIVVFKTNPHGEDIPAVQTVEIVDVPRESTRELMRDGQSVTADISFKNKDGGKFTYYCDNHYVNGYHSGLDRYSDIAKGASFFEIKHFE